MEAIQAAMKYEFYKTFDDRALYNCVAFYRNEARWRYQKARNGFIRAELAKQGAANIEDLDRHKRRELEGKLKENELCEGLRLSYEGWKIIFSHLKRKEIYGTENED